MYVEPPAEAQEPADVVWRLDKALPGLKGGTVAWGARIDGILGSPPLNFRRSRVDPCWWTNSTTGVRIGRHMDDFIKTGPPKAVQAVMEYLERVAQLKITLRTHDLTPLDPSEHKLYRRVVGRFLYCSAHRGDFAFTLNQSCRRVQSPT